MSSEKDSTENRALSNTERQNNFIEKLMSGRGKRILLNLDSEHVTALNDLVDAGFGESQTDAIRKAIMLAAGKQKS